MNPDADPDAGPATGARPLRVAYFDAYPHTLGGAQRTMLDIAAGVARRDVSVSIHLPGEGPVADEARARGLDVSIWHAPPALRIYGGGTRNGRAVLAALSALRGTVRLRREFRAVDVVHVNDHRGMLLAAPAARLARVSVVWHSHITSQWPLATRLANRLATSIVAVSPAAIPSPARTDVAVEAPPAPPLPAPRDPHERSHRPSVVCVARRHPDKGVDVLVRAFERVAATVPDAHLRLIGGPWPGCEQHEVEIAEAADRLGAAVSLEPWEPEVDGALRGAWVYVQPSRRESFGLAVLEAMAVGVPVVATATEGLRASTDGAARLVRPGDADELAAAVTALLGDDAERERLTTASLARIARLADPEQAFDGWVHRYEAIARHRSQRRHTRLSS